MKAGPSSLGARGPLWLVLVAGLCAAAPGTALGKPSNWLLQHLALDMAGAVGWRAAWVDDQHRGFQALGAGGEANLGIEFDSGWAVLAGGRVLAGSAPSPDASECTPSYFEATGHLGAQLRLTEWVRVGAGASLGQMWRCASPMNGDEGKNLIAGGFLRMGVDWLPRNGPFLRALSLWLRVDIDGHPADSASSLPTSTLALGLGLGLRI